MNRVRAMRGRGMAIMPAEIESRLQRIRDDVDLQSVHSQYWLQDEFVVLDKLLPQVLIDAMVAEARLVQPRMHRNYVPGHKKGGSVSFYTLREQAPVTLNLYRSPALRWLLSRITESDLLLCPEDDPHSCALYFYTKPGDHIGFHYDTSYYKGRRYTVLIGLVERSDHCRLVARVRLKGQAEEIRETRIPMGPGAVVLFNGDRLWHAVTPLAEGEERIVLTLQYVTNQAMGPAKRLFSNLKDAFAYFGPAVLARRRSGAAGRT